jgi:pyruvate dehydrogenase E2 component (dihydrolipoyllysine-residue acetyltransferase)
MTDITMPRLSDSMEEGTILKWLKSDGDSVTAGEDLVEIETDKATMTYASDHDGVLEIVAGEGSNHPVGAVIAHVGADAEQTAEPQRTPESEPERNPAPERDDHEHNGREPASEAPVMTAATASPATPLAKRAASQHRVDLESLTGTGPRGRITRADVLAAAGVKEPSTVTADSLPTPVTPRVGSADGDSQIQTPTRVQRVIAQRMATAHATIPSFEVQTEAAMDAVLAMRASLKDVAGDDPVPSINDLLIKACALALRRHPRVNASYSDGSFVLHSRVNVGFAVAAEEALIVPTVHDADTKSLGAIARDTRELAGTFGRYVHGLEPGHVRDDRDPPGDQPATGLDTRRGSCPPGSGAQRGRDRRPYAGHADPVQRPSDPVRRRRRWVPRRGTGSNRGAAPPRAVTPRGKPARVT